jgi:hypothetical protein
MTVISAIQDYIKGYTELDKDAPVWVNYLSDSPVEYSIVPIPGEQIIAEYVTGKTSREFPFALQSMESTADEVARLESLGFYEEFAEWLRSQSEAGYFPEMDEGQSPFKIYATGWGMLFEQGQSQTGIYQIQCKLEYEQNS